MVQSLLICSHNNMLYQFCLQVQNVTINCFIYNCITVYSISLYVYVSYVYYLRFDRSNSIYYFIGLYYLLQYSVYQGSRIFIKQCSGFHKILKSLSIRQLKLLHTGNVVLSFRNFSHSLRHSPYSHRIRIENKIRKKRSKILFFY